jgi:hypothetical protein
MHRFLDNPSHISPPVQSPFRRRPVISRDCGGTMAAAASLLSLSPSPSLSRSAMPAAEAGQRQSLININANKIVMDAACVVGCRRRDVRSRPGVSPRDECIRPVGRTTGVDDDRRVHGGRRSVGIDDAQGYPEDQRKANALSPAAAPSVRIVYARARSISGSLYTADKRSFCHSDVEWGSAPTTESRTAVARSGFIRTPQGRRLRYCRIKNAATTRLVEDLTRRGISTSVITPAPFACRLRSG